jgi:hypothetical protein
MQSFKLQLTETDKKILIGSAILASLTIPTVAKADTAAVGDTVTAIGGVTAGVATIVLTAMGFRIAVKQVNRMTTKG